MSVRHRDLGDPPAEIGFFLPILTFCRTGSMRINEFNMELIRFKLTPY